MLNTGWFVERIIA